MTKQLENNKKFALSLLFFLVLFSFFNLSPTLAQQTQTNQNSSDSATGNNNASSAQNSTLNDFFKNLNDKKNKGSGYSARGIYSCQGAVYSFIGLSGPSGYFVPVHDDATFSQVQSLTYKECVLDKAAAHLSSAATASIVSNYIMSVNKNGLIIKDVNEYLNKEEAKAIKNFTKKCKEKLKEVGAEIACISIAENYLKKYKDPYNDLKCDISKDKLEKFKNNKLSELSMKDMQDILFSPSCVPLRAAWTAKIKAQEIADKARSKALYEAPNGIKPQKAVVNQKVLAPDGTIAENKEEVVVTPSSVVTEQLNYALGAGLRKVENADEMDEIAQTFLANLSNRILNAEQQGLYGISKSVGSDTSYLQQLVNQEINASKQARVSLGATSLAQAIKREQEYISYKEKIVNALLAAVHRLRKTEDLCFEKKIIPGAQDSLNESVKTSLCPVPQQNGHSGGQNGPQNIMCSVSIKNKMEKLPDFLDITETEDSGVIEHGSITLNGTYSGSGNATVSFVNEKNKVVNDSIPLKDKWSANKKLSDLPDGALDVTLTYPNSKVLKNSLYKETISSIPILVLPEKRYKIKLISEGSATVVGAPRDTKKELILEINRKHSLEYSNKDSVLIKSLRDTLQSLKDAKYVLAELVKIAQESQSDPESATWKIDQILANNASHGPAQVRKAKQNAEAIESQLDAYVSGITGEDGWQSKSGWCQKENWGEFKVERSP